MLNNRKDRHISEDTRTLVLNAARELGYTPNHVARALATGKTNVVSLWTGEFTVYYALLMKNLQKHAKRLGYHILVNDIRDLTALEVRSTGPVDGIIALDYPMVANNVITSTPEFNTPLVSLGTNYLDNVDHVGIDLYDVSHEAVEHLLSIGCKRIAFAFEESSAWYTEQRCLAYRDTLSDAGIQPEFIQVFGGDRVDGRNAIKNYIAQYGCPDGIFCHNDEKAIGIYRGLCDLGVHVPDEVALIGCDGLPETEYLEHPISTIQAPVDDMCLLAWNFLYKRITSPAAEIQTANLIPKLLIRDSSNRSSG